MVPSEQDDADWRKRPMFANRDAWRFAGAGLELGGSAIVFAAIGYAIDRQMGNTTMVATAFGAVLGFAAGMYRFIRMAMEANRSQRDGRND